MRGERERQWRCIAVIVSFTALSACAGRGDIAVDAAPVESVPAQEEHLPVAAVEPAQGEMELVLAARYGQEATVRRLLDGGADINGRDALGRTALIAAAAEPGTAMVRLLLERGAGLEARDRDGSDALMAAVMKGRLQNVSLLLDAGAQIDARNPLGETALMVAIRTEQTAVAEHLLERGADHDVYDQEQLAASDAYTPLMYVARYLRGQDGLRMLDRLVRSGAAAGSHRAGGETALTLAQRNGQQEMVARLRALGVRDERPYAGLSQGDALLRAIRLDDAGKAQQLLAAEVDVNYRNTLTGITPLASAAYHGRQGLLEMLVRAGARIDDVPWGLREERIAVSSVPLAERDLMRVAARGDTALIGAIRRADRAMIVYLLDAGAGLMVPNREGETPGLVAARAGNGSVVALLLERGLDPNVQVFPERISYLLTRYAQGEVLPPMLVEAARFGREDAVATLLRAGAAVDARDTAGRTALHWAAAAGHESIVRLLLAQRARTDLADRAGDSALALARSGGADEVVRLLSVSD